MVGAGGHCRSVIDSVRKAGEYEPIGILDVEEKVGFFVDGVEIVGTDQEMKAYFNRGIKYAFLSLGSVGNTRLRFRLYRALRECGFELPNIIDVSAVMAGHLTLGQGIFIGKNAVINVGSIIGDSCIINTGAIIEHDCELGEFVHVATGAILCGDVDIGAHTHIGAGSTVIQGIHIGANTVIGAGSTVVSDIEENVVAFGTPCRIHR